MYWPKFEAIIPEMIDLRNKIDYIVYFMDSIHLNVKGHVLVDEAIFEKLKELL
jgi:poly-D-alanine transfer protein DltD